MNTPTQAVLQIGQIRLTGNIIPHIWYHRLTHRSGKPYLEAIIVLSDVLYWYTPKEVRDEKTGKLIRLEKRFAADKLQRSYDQLAEMFGFGKDQARNACKYLAERGLISLEFRTVPVRGTPMSNVLFIEPVPEAIQELNTPIGTETDTLSVSKPTPPIGSKTDTLSAQEPTPISTETDTLSAEEPTGVGTETDTYTEITSEITTEISSGDHDGDLLKDLIDLTGLQEAAARALLVRYGPVDAAQWLAFVLDERKDDPAAYLYTCCIRKRDPPPVHYAVDEVDDIRRRFRRLLEYEGEEGPGADESAGEGTPAQTDEPAGDVGEIWAACLQELEFQMTRATFNTWVKPAHLVAVDTKAGTAVIETPNQYVKDWLDNRLNAPIARTLAGIAGKSGDQFGVTYRVAGT